MNTREKIYCGIIVLAVVGGTVLLNSEKIRYPENTNQIVNQDNQKYNSIESSEKEVQLAIEEDDE